MSSCAVDGFFGAIGALGELVPGVAFAFLARYSAEYALIFSLFEEQYATVFAFIFSSSFF
jgi:nitrate/nitrite transporter NarK